MMSVPRRRTYITAAYMSQRPLEVKVKGLAIPVLSEQYLQPQGTAGAEAGRIEAMRDYQNT